MDLAEYLAVVRWKGSRVIAIPSIEQVLATDPYAFDKRRVLAGFLYEEGDQAGATREMTIVQHYLPRKPIPIIINANPNTN